MAPPDLAMQLPYATPDLPGIGGKLRARPESFVVEEVPLYEPSGEGSHLYLTLTKANLTTKEVQQRLERLLGTPRGSVGYAGLKDKAAQTTQTFSLLLNSPPEQDVSLVERIAGELPVTIVQARRHRNKLKTGHLLGNRFRITIHDLELPTDEALARAEAIAARLRVTGLPNYFGPQRFGMHGDNALLGYEILTGSRHLNDRWRRQFLVTSYQSYLSNRYLALRTERGAFLRLWAGDIAKKHATGGLFVVEDAALEQPRFDAHEISYTAPMFGSKMMRARQEAGALEAEIEAETGLTDVAWRKANTEGTRRLGRLLLPDLRPAAHPDGVVVDFFLPKGGFATTILRELMKGASDAPDGPLLGLPDDGGDE